MNSQLALIESVLLAAEVFVVGLYAGIHWFNYLGGLPALQDLGNVPINVDIQSWRLNAIPGRWRDVRGALRRYFRFRGALSLAAYAVLVCTVVCVWERR